MMVKFFKKYPKIFFGTWVFIVSFGTLFYPAYIYISKRYIQNLPPPVQSNTTNLSFLGNSLHARSQKMSDLFASANTVLTKAIAKVEAAQHADQLPHFKDELHDYRKQFIYYGTSMPFPIGIGYSNFFTRGTLSCERSLERLAWLGSDVRAAFTSGEKQRLLADLHQKLAQLASIQATCVAAAPHYYGFEKNELQDVINGDFERASISTLAAGGAYFSIFLQTTLRIDEVQLLGLAPASAADLQTLALEEMNKHCKGGAVQTLVDPVPSAARAQSQWGGGIVLVRRGRRGGGGGGGSNIDSNTAAGEIWCGANKVNIGAALLRAGLATIDFAQVLSPKVTSAAGSSISIDTHPEYFAALNEARQARRGVWALAKNMQTMK